MRRWDGDLLIIDGVRFRTVSADAFGAALDDLDGARAVFRDVATAPAPEPAMLVWKSREMVEDLITMLEELQPRRIVELGIAQGGSTALLAALAPDARLVSVELADRPTGGLLEHIAREGLGERVRPYYGVDQSDVGRVGEILADEFRGEPIDLVIDDASHIYDLTVSSFDLLYPLVRRGGTFVIEDWACDDPPAPDAEGEPLSELIVDLVRRLASGDGSVASIEAIGAAVRVQRGDAPIAPGWSVRTG